LRFALILATTVTRCIAAYPFRIVVGCVDSKTAVNNKKPALLARNMY